MPVTNQQMLEKWDSLPAETRSQTIVSLHIATVEGALDKGTIVRRELDLKRKSGQNMSDYVLFLIHKDEHTTLNKVGGKNVKFGPRQTFWAELKPRARVSTSGIPKPYRERFEYVKENAAEGGKMFAVVVASKNATVHTVDLARDEEILAKKTVDANAAIVRAEEFLSGEGRSDEMRATLNRLIEDARSTIAKQTHAMVDVVREIDANIARFTAELTPPQPVESAT